jgi:aspartate/methionine/tyrosine aminotransferase
VAGGGGDGTRGRAVLFADEVYRMLEYNPSDRLPAACELSSSAMSLGVMSKAFRVGRVAGGLVGGA